MNIELYFYTQAYQEVVNKCPDPRVLCDWNPEGHEGMNLLHHVEMSMLNVLVQARNSKTRLLDLLML